MYKTPLGDIIPSKAERRLETTTKDLKAFISRFWALEERNATRAEYSPLILEYFAAGLRITDLKKPQDYKYHKNPWLVGKKALAYVRLWDALDRQLHGELREMMKMEAKERNKTPKAVKVEKHPKPWDRDAYAVKTEMEWNSVTE